jgi:glycosyltransferase involved in cell wall biosynthesis
MRQDSCGSGSLEIFFSPDFAGQTVGGVSRYFCRLHAGLLEAGHRSTVIAGLYVNEYLQSLPRVVGFRVPAFRPARPRVLAGQALEALCMSLAGRNSIFHKTYYSARAHRPTKAVVVTVFDMIHERFPEFFGVNSQTTRWKRDWCAAADLILAISHCTRRDLIEIFNVPPDKVMVTHLGVDLVGPSEGTRMQRRHGDFLLYVGGRSLYKNFTTLLRALAAARGCSKIKLVCFGGGPPAPAEQSLIHDLELDGVVEFVTGGDDALHDYYAGATAFVYPSLYEGFGLPPLEAMAHGCPVACSATSSLPEVVGDCALTFDPRDADALAASLKGIWDSSSLRARLATAGRERAASFTWKRTVEKTIAAYRTIGAA